jgi:hypothetical protein
VFRTSESEESVRPGLVNKDDLEGNFHSDA